MMGSNKVTFSIIFLSVLGLFLFSRPVSTFADESQVASSDGSIQQSNNDALIENSWRYSNGNLVLDDYGIAEQSMGDSELPEGATARGIDVSEHQGDINWEKVKASGIKYAIIRIGFAGEGFGGRCDRKWQRNVEACERLGIPYGVYLYSYAKNVAEATDEANLALKYLANHKPSLPVFYDVEDKRIDKSALDSTCSTFCNLMEQHGFSTGIYSSLSWFNNYLSTPTLKKWDRWIASWGASSCKYNGTFSYWQYTATGFVDGISGYVDLDYSYVDFSSTKSGLCWQDNKLFYKNSDGTLASGERCVDGKWYYFDPEAGCAAATGVTDLGYKTVCYAADGHMLYGEQKVGDGWYHFDPVTGKMSTGLTDLGYKTVLYGDDGRMLYGAQDVPGRGRCYFDGVTGALVTPA